MHKRRAAPVAVAAVPDERPKHIEQPVWAVPQIPNTIPLILDVRGLKFVSRHLQHEDHFGQVGVQWVDHYAPAIPAAPALRRLCHLLVRCVVVPQRSDDFVLQSSMIIPILLASRARHAVPLRVPPNFCQNVGLVFARLAQHRPQIHVP